MRIPRSILIALLIVMSLAVILLGILLATDYVPATGISASPEHELRFGVLAGIVVGLEFAVAVIVFGSDNEK